MAYDPLYPTLPNKSIFNADHLAHLENGILNANSDSREYIDGVAVQIQAGQVTDAAFDAAVDRAAADGRLVVEGGGGEAPGVAVTETQPGAYQFVSGATEATIYGLTSAQTLPTAAKTDLRTEFSTKTEIQEAGYLTTVPDTSVAALVQDVATSTGAALAARYATKGEAETTDAEVNTIVTGSTTTASSLAARYATKMPKALNMRDLGAHGNNTVDNAAFKTAMTMARDGRRTSPNGLASDPLGTYTIELPSGDFRITDIQGLIGAEGTTVKTRGLRFRGAGSDLTQIIFDPATAGELCYNRYWQNIKFEGITFSTTVAGSTFMHSWAVNGSAPQEYTFTDVKWNGPWKYVFNLQGSNNNCEFRFFGCMSTGMVDDGAFLYVGGTDTSDQFLNYWFYGFKHWSTGAALVDMARGGHVHLFGVDASAWGVNLTAPRYLLNLRGSNHAHGVQALTARALRVEAKNANAGLLYSEWAEGNVDIQCDWSSQIGYYTYGDIIKIDTTNVNGPIYNFHDSNLAGGVSVKYGVNAWQKQHSITFNDCVWNQRVSQSEVVNYDDTAAGGNVVRPAVTFKNVRFAGYNDARGAGGATVTDATIGHNRGALVKTGGRRSITVRNIRGTIQDSDTALKLNLPVGAMITTVRAVAPPNASGDTDGGSWTFSTTETTPTVIATATVTGAMNAGYHGVSELPVPFHCTTRERATITVKSAGVGFPQLDAFLTIEGYW